MPAQTTSIAIARQASKGTAATTNFHRSRWTSSSAFPRFDHAEYLNEHSGQHQRASSRQSQSERTSVIIPIRLSGALYPNVIGAILAGLGFSDNVTGTTEKTHAWTKAAADAAVYATVMQAVLEGGNRFERKIKDVRFTSWQLEATRTTLQHTVDGVGLDEAESAGTETVSNDVAYKLLPSKGAISFGALALGAPRQHTCTILRPVDEEDQKLHSFGRNDLPEIGFEINGQMRGLDMSYSSYKKLVWGGTSGTAPDQVIVTDSLTFSFASAQNISSNPYSLQIAIAKAQMMLSNFEAAGNGVVRFDMDYQMIDESNSAPVTITLVNAVTSY